MGKSIYNIIHVGDHAQFSNSLVPMSLREIYMISLHSEIFLSGSFIEMIDVLWIMSATSK